MEAVLVKLMEAVSDELIEAGFEYLRDQVRWQTGMKEELQRLLDIHPKIQAVAAFASTQLQIKDPKIQALNIWLWQLRDAIDEADDVLDEFEYMKLKQQLMTRNMEETKKRKFPFIPSFSYMYESARNKILKVGERALKTDPNLKRLEEVVQKLDKVSVGVDTFIHLVKDAKLGQREQQEELYRARETGAMPKNDQIGRAEEKDFVLQWLTKPSNEQQTTLIAGTTNLYKNISLLSIVGLGGMGKTTLLQHVYEEVTTKEEFNLKIWVCVSNNFDAKKVIVDMLEYLNKERPRSETLATLQESLKSVVTSNKFLLVLDDIWDEEEEERNKSKWEDVLAPLAYGSLGSKILVTTRMDSAASMIANVIKKKKETLKLKGLEEAECLQLLNSHAFAGENPDDHRKLRSIAEKIVRKLSGSPLAARVVGGVLNSCLEESHWTRVLDYDIGNQNDILQILKLSYMYLPKSLQNCFSFCGIFPQDYEFDKNDMIQMWIALSFIQPTREETAKDIGERYFYVLIKKSLLDEFQIEDKTYYKIHDLLHDMVRSVSTHECSNIIGDDEELVSKIPKTIRHLFVKTDNPGVITKMKKFKNLHSLYLSSNSSDDNFDNALNDIFKTLRSIRLFKIYAPRQKQMPEEIGQLIHLRYLNIYTNKITRLPRSLSNLFHLQFMNYHCYGSNEMNLPDDTLPRDMNNLPNLQYLKLPFPGMHEIGKVNSLQELDGFYVKNESGYRIEELERMNKLRLLKINHLQNVNNVQEACSAKLYEKRNLTDLYLSWRDSSPRNDDIIDLPENVLDNLKPHENLKKLKIDSFMGVRSASWMNKFQTFSSLEYIKVENCYKWETLPPFGQFPSLKFLYLSNMPKAKRIIFHRNDEDFVFPSLQVLQISYLNALEDWFDSRAAIDDRLFPCLTDLCLNSCPNLRELPSLPPKLNKLEINEIGWKTLNWLKGTGNCCSISIKDCSNVISLSGLITEKCQLILNRLHINDPFMLLTTPLRSTTSLENLAIQRNDAVVSFPFDEEQWFSTLWKLNFLELKSLQSLPSSFLMSLSSLKILEVDSVPQLQVLPNLPASLERLILSNLESLQSLPSSLESLSSLKILWVRSVPQLQVLPNLPASLEKLILSRLESLQSLPSSFSESLSSLKILVVDNVPQLQVLPNLPTSLEELKLEEVKSLQSLPSSLESLSSLKILNLRECPLLQVLPNLPTSLENLWREELESLQSLPSSLESLSSLKSLRVWSVPLLQVLPNLPASLEVLILARLESLQSLPSSLESLSSLKILKMIEVPQLQVLPNLPTSLEELDLYKVESLQSLPSSLESLSSLKILMINTVPQLQVLPNLPASLEKLELNKIESLQSLPSSLESISSLKILEVGSIPQLQVLPNLPASLEKLQLSNLESLQSLPCSLESLSSLKILNVFSVPQLQVLPNHPASLEQLHLSNLESLESLASSLESLSSLKSLRVWYVPLLQVLPNLPTSLEELVLEKVESLQSLPSSLESLSSLQLLFISECPHLSELPDLPPYLKSLTIASCHPELTERYRQFAGSEWHKIAHIPNVYVI